MKQAFEINGFYGSGHNETTVFVMDNNDGSFWYVAEGGQTVNMTTEPLHEGVDIEELRDVDCFTWPKGINSLDEFEAAIEA